MANLMNISFIVPAHNEELLLGGCLKSILALKNDPSFHEIIVVDNASTDRTKAIAESFDGVTVLSETQKGPTHARARGLAAASGDYCACIDADTRVSREWLERVKRALSSLSDIVALSGPYRYPELPRWQQATKRAIDLSAHWLRRVTGSRSIRATGGNAVYNVAALRAAGGFHSAVPFFGDDVEVFMRLREHGRVVFDVHLRADSSSRRLVQHGFFRTIAQYTLNSLWLQIRGKPLFSKEEDYR